MARTRKRFRTPSPSPSLPSSGSSSDEEPGPRGRGKQLPGHFGRGKHPMGSFGRGKQLNASAPGRGKQFLRAKNDSPAREGEEEDSGDDSSSGSEEEELPPVARRGRGKKLRLPSPDAPEGHSSSSSEEEEEEAPPPRFWGGGKMLPRQPAPAGDDSSSSSSEEEPWAAPVQRGWGKQLNPPSVAPPGDSGSSSGSEEEPWAAPVQRGWGKRLLLLAEEPAPELAEESSSESEEEEPRLQGGRGRPSVRAAATRAARSASEAAEEERSEGSGEGGEDIEDEGGSDEEGEWDAETYDAQKLVADRDDEKHLDSLTELERESILAERFEKLKSEADMKKALRENRWQERERKKAAGAQKKQNRKRKAPKTKKASPFKTEKPPVKKKKVQTESLAEGEEKNDEDEDIPDVTGDKAFAQSLAGKRVSARNLDEKGKKFKKQAALAKIRENRAKKQVIADKSDSEMDYGGDSGDSDDDYEDNDKAPKPWQQKKKNITKEELGLGDDALMCMRDDKTTSSPGRQWRTEDSDAALEDYIKVTIPRRRLMRWCNEPFFEKAVMNFYVRLSIGTDGKTQRACYRLCRITGIVTRSEYSFDSDDGKKPVSTDKWLKLSFGKSVRVSKITIVSNHGPSTNEVAQLVSQLKTERLTELMLTKKSANKLRKNQNILVNNYAYTKEDIDMLIKEKKKSNKKSLNIGSEKTRIAIAVQAAKHGVEEAKKRLENIKVERMEADDTITTIAESGVAKANQALEAAKEKLEEKIKEQKKIAKEDKDRINKLKRSSKVQNWAKVNQRARLANQNADFRAYRQEQEREKPQGSAEPKFDPYARRRPKPKNLWEVGGAKQEKSPGTVEEKRKETTPSERDDSGAGKDADKDTNQREDLSEPQKEQLQLQQAAKNQFAFDDDFGGDITNLGRIGKKKVWKRARKGISLEEYRERKTE